MAKSNPALWLKEPDRYPRVLENFRAFKAKMIALKSSAKSSVFLLTGTERGVGTSSACFNLALTMALDLPDKKILLVDGDLDSPSLGGSFGVDESPGLSDLIQKGGIVEDVIQPASSPNLHLVTAGQQRADSGMTFSMDAFSAFLEEARRLFDYVLIDSAPVLRSSATRMLAPEVDGVILVVEANRTRSEVVSAAQEHLSGEGATLVGSFLNRRRFVIPRWLYRFI